MFNVTIYLNWKTDTYQNVVTFGPTPGKDLLAITLDTGETIVYPLSRIKKYTFVKEPDNA